MTVWYCFKKERTLGKRDVNCDLTAAHKKCGWMELHPAGTRTVGADALVIEPDRLHALIADAIWLSVTGDSMESACEFADLVLQAFGAPKVADGASGYVRPFAHPGALDAALKKLEAE